jgi:hypothetical protein
VVGHHGGQALHGLDGGGQGEVGLVEAEECLALLRAAGAHQVRHRPPRRAVLLVPLEEGCNLGRAPRSAQRSRHLPLLGQDAANSERGAGGPARIRPLEYCAGCSSLAPCCSSHWSKGFPLRSRVARLAVQ